ncbi:MAG: hypothetical protein ACLP9L_14900 [Thermoguttaceae bacterium]
MFWITTATAIVCAMTFSMPEMVAVPLFVLFSVVLTAVLITIIIHGGSYERTFCIGAVVPFGVLLVSLAFGGVVFIDGPSRLNFLAFRLAVVGSWVSSLLVGVICMGVRRLLEYRRDSQKP